MISERELDADLKERGQRAPLVLTFDGYVVDGNRRLVALREEKEQYAEAVVLPEDAQSHEIYETEIELQMQRETKAPYDWVDQAVHIEYGITVLGERPEVVAKRMRMTKDAVTDELRKLELVRMYLAWLGQEGKIHKVPTSSGGQMRQAFEDMADRFAAASFNRKKEPERRMIREMCFAHIKRGAGYKEIRGMIKQLSQNAKRISHKLRERRPPAKKHHSGGDHARFSMGDSATFVASRMSVHIQKLNFKANWIIRGLLLVEMMRPKLPALSTCPVVRSIRPPEAKRAFRLLIGLAKFG